VRVKILEIDSERRRLSLSVKRVEEQLPHIKSAAEAGAAAAAEAGGLDRINRVVKVTGFVASAPGFNAQPQVLNGASELIGEVFGEAGLHARAAVGVAELPLDAPVEVEIVAELEA
jgi:enamine deaminase RidA (YjgF/YER057c/UK114 family)